MQQMEMRSADPNEPVWVDLGCGTAKQPGFIGIDRFRLPGVDIVCDLEQGIPLRSDSVDYVLASHSLEHLRDMPAAISEIYRICRDRAVVAIVAPYDATRLNRANPYHVQTWNEHTARFFTSDTAPTISAEDYRFPAAGHWGLLASDFTTSDVDLRCLWMEFTYLPAYRGLDEQTKRTLRQSLSDVCDQMALHLLVIKSPIADDELTRRAATIQFPLPPSFEARRSAEADTGAQNLFSELARTPARLAAASAKANEEIALLGDEMRRFVARIDHIERALVAEAQEAKHAVLELAAAGRTLSERMTAINSAATRRLQGVTDDVDILRHGLGDFSQKIIQHLVEERRARADRSFLPVRYLRRFQQRKLDLRAVIGGAFTRLWEGPEAPNRRGFKLQAGTFLQPNVTRTYPLIAHGSTLRAIDIGVLAIFVPSGPITFCNYELRDHRDMPLRAGTVVLDQTCRSSTIAIEFDPLGCEPGQSLHLLLTPLGSVDQIGAQLLEWHRITRLLRRVPEMQLACRGRYDL